MRSGEEGVRRSFLRLFSRSRETGRVHPRAQAIARRAVARAELFHFRVGHRAARGEARLHVRVGEERAHEGVVARDVQGERDAGRVARTGVGGGAVGGGRGRGAAARLHWRCFAPRNLARAFGRLAARYIFLAPCFDGRDVVAKLVKINAGWMVVTPRRVPYRNVQLVPNVVHFEQRFRVHADPARELADRFFFLLCPRRRTALVIDLDEVVRPDARFEGEGEGFV